MKKFILMLVVALAAVGTASAEKVNAFSYTKSKTNTMWYGRVGLSVNNAAGVSALKYSDEGTDWSEKQTFGSTVGMDVDFGFQKAIGTSGLYWGMELGIGSRGFSEKWTSTEEYYDEKYSDEEKGSVTLWNVKYSPVTIGYKYSLTDQIKLDAHFGLFASYDFAGKKIKMNWKDSDGDSDKWEESFDGDDFDYQGFDAGMQVGVGVWYGRLNLDFTYQRGFVPAAKYHYDGEDHNAFSSNFMIRLGVAF